MFDSKPAGTKTVLVVEDDADNRAIYSTLLKHEGYRVIEASDGEMALLLIRAWLPHLVLLDISLPRLDGWAVAGWMKESGRLRAIPIVGLSAHAEREARDRAARVGFAEYLIKPIEPREVLNCVKHFIGEPRGPALFCSAV